ncbi:Transposase DDE domain-containing protein [Bradyrhizobium brasilense]|uniref:Transposase DDE domain-containing protein n=1 Tax=Bradyrhizobium brasilense TaxID=1419277 RepID=A0A1G7HQJ8_9BRAD|nr:transposase [Bradyrhizobium brasilense]SDF02757.1 Transposase DDE domain-containing protein [Bradyrhizobium brasilense]
MPEAKVERLKGKIEKLKEEIVRLNAINAEMMKSEDKQISLSDPDARSMATSGKDTGIAVDTQHHLIVAHDVINVGSDRHQLSNMAGQARAEMAVETLEVVADRGDYDGEELRACEQAGVTVTLPKPLTSGAKAAGRFGKQDFVYVSAEDIYRCPAGERLIYRFTGQEDGKMLRRYWTTACQGCGLKALCTTGPERRIARWEHEAVLEKVQRRLDQDPNKITLRCQAAEHPFGTIKAWMGATHFLMQRRHKVGKRRSAPTFSRHTG